MANTQTQGTVSQPTSQNASRDMYADYYELNEEAPAEGTEVVTPTGDQGEHVGVKDSGTPEDPSSKERQAADAEPPAPETPKPERTPHWKKQIDKQTRRIRELEEQIARTEAKTKQVKEEPRHGPDNYLTEEEYRTAEAKRAAREGTYEAQLELQREELGRLAESTSETEFRGSWAERTDRNFDGDPEGRAQLAQLVRNNKTPLHQDIHDFMDHAEYGPRTMQVLLLRPDIVANINRAKPIARYDMLTRLHREVESYMTAGGSSQIAQPQAAPAPRKVSQAPTPLAPVGQAAGSPLNQDDEDEAYRARFEKQRFGIRR
jgi:hypothetical protein